MTLLVKKIYSDGPASKIFIGIKKSNCNANIAKRFIDEKGYLRMEEIRKLLTEINQSSKRGTPSSNLLAIKNRENPNIYPNPILLMSWFKASSWPEFLNYFGYSVKVKDLSAQKEYYRQCLKLAQFIIKQEKKQNLSRTIYDSLSFFDVEKLINNKEISNAELFSMINKDNYEKLKNEFYFPSSQKISNTFGSWNTAKEEISATIYDTNTRPHLEQNELLEKLLEFIKVLKHLPNRKDLYNEINKNICPKNDEIFRTHFKNLSWAEILLLAVKKLRSTDQSEYVDFSHLTTPLKADLSRLMKKSGLEDFYRKELTDYMITTIRKLKSLPNSVYFVPNNKIKYSIYVYFNYFETDSWADILFEAIKKIQGTEDEKYIKFDKLAEKTKLRLIELINSRENNNDELEQKGA